MKIVITVEDVLIGDVMDRVLYNVTASIQHAGLSTTAVKLVGNLSELPLELFRKMEWAIIDIADHAISREALTSKEMEGQGHESAP